MKDPNKVTIGQLAHKAGVSSVAIRHYERLKLLPKAERGENDYRLYPEEATLKRLMFIVNAKEAGFSLQEVRELLDLRQNKSTSSFEIKEYVSSKVIDVKQKIKALQSIVKTLEKLVSRCDGKMPLGQCPILDALDNQTSKKRKKK